MPVDAAEPIPPGAPVPMPESVQPGPGSQGYQPSASFSPEALAPVGMEQPLPGQPIDAGPFANLGRMASDGSTMYEIPLGPCDYLGQGVACPPVWYLQENVRVLTRTRTRDDLLSFYYDPFTGTSEQRLSTKTLGLDGSLGYDTTLGRHLGRDVENRDHFLELTFWGLHNWEEHATATSARVNFFDGRYGTLFTPFVPTPDPTDTPVGGFNRAQRHEIFYESDLNNWEVNVRVTPRGRADRLVLLPTGRWRRELNPGHKWAFLYGARVMSIDERFQFISSGRINDASGNHDIAGYYDVRTHNTMLGIQFGLDFTQQHERWHWGVQSKVAGFVNFAEQYSDISTFDQSDLASINPNFSVGDQKNEVSGAVELRFTTRYMITPTFWVHGSYDLMWVAGLALAPENVRFSTDPIEEITANGTTFYHGLRMGVEWRF